jgi:hypothetical protein
MASLRCTVLAISVVLSLGACSGKDPTRPGESIGVFAVSGKLVSSTCGATPDPWKFDVRLRHEERTLYWVQGDAPISGQVDPQARAVLTSSDVRQMRAADAKSKTPACNMSRTDALDLVLAPVVKPVTDVAGVTSFKGTLTYRFAATEGSSCEDQLADSGGDFAAIPCDVSYEIDGLRTGNAK